MSKITIFSDGGARGNPGQGAVGCVIRQIDQETKRQRETKISKKIGVVTNNQAEYRGVIEALKWIKDNRDKQDNQDNRENTDNPEIECYLDSKLVVEQLNLRYKLKHHNLKPLFDEVRMLVMALGGKVSFHYIPREENKEADRLVNEALDKR